MRLGDGIRFLLYVYSPKKAVMDMYPFPPLGASRATTESTIFDSVR